MTPRENMLRIFRHEKPEWIPLTCHVDPYNQPSKTGMPPDLAARLADVKWCDGSTVHLSRALGIDVMDYTSAPLRHTYRQVTIENRRDGNIAITTWHTPAGDLTQRQCIPADGPPYIIEHLVKTPADLPILAAAFADEYISVDEKAVEQISLRTRMVGEDGILMHFMSGTPLGMMYRVYSGVENLAYLWSDAPDMLHDLFKVMEANYQREFQLTAAHSSADAMVGMDDTSTTTISPDMFEACNLELTDQRTAIAHAAGKLYFHHSCGLIKNLLPLYRRTQMDAVHAYSPPTLGDATVAEGRRTIADRITMIVSLGQMAGSLKDRAAVRANIRSYYEEAGNGDHIIFSLAAYPDKTFADMQFLVECCRPFQGGMPVTTKVGAGLTSGRLVVERSENQAGTEPGWGHPGSN